MLPLPIGIENFQETINKYYVDKTMLIKDIVLTNLYSAVLITRPRRFGKSLAISMLETFFSDEIDGNQYFKDKKISHNWEEYNNYLNKYPVIHLNMKNIQANDIDALYDLIDLEISKIYIKNYDRISSHLSKDELKNVELLMAQKAPLSLLMNSVELLTLYINKATGKKPILLIDEYDTPIQVAHDNGYYKQAISFFKTFYTSALKGNNNLTLAVVTGVMQISKESSFSGLNNLRVYSVIDNKLSSYFGFTELEVKEMLNYYHIEEPIEKINKYYGGYLFGNTKLYNPWSILNFIDNDAKYRFYWKNSGTNHLLLGENNQANDVLIEIYGEDTIYVQINNSLSYNDIQNSKEAYYSFLLQCGYLTVAEESNNNYFKITKPNLEASDAFKTEIIDRYFNGGKLFLPLELKNALANKDDYKIKQLFEKYILSSFSYFDYKNEKNYQILTLGIMAVLFDDSIVKSEVNSTNGRADIVISPKNENEIGVVLEIKYSKTIISKQRLTALTEKGLKQIKDHHYTQGLIERKANPILIYSFAFDGEHINVLSEKVR